MCLDIELQAACAASEMHKMYFDQQLFQQGNCVWSTWDMSQLIQNKFQTLEEVICLGLYLLQLKLS